MSQIDAVFQDGVFRPLGPVALPSNQRVRLTYNPVGHADALSWLKAVQALQSRLVAAHGVYPSSVDDIANDRRR